MKATIRRTIEMATRVMNFSRAHPNPSSGYSAALARLEKALAEADVLAARQRDGINAVRSATRQKRALRRKMRRTQLVHLARVAESAAAELPDIAQKFRLSREGVPYLAFRTAARGMSAEAQSQKEILVKHGLLDEVLESLARSLDEFDKAVGQGTDGRRAHVGASAELDAVADELGQIVRLMDGLNRFRFADDATSLAEWVSASNTVARSGGRVAVDEGPPATLSQGGEIKPAA
ncbi:MAG TPA: hypothetical protein VFO71_12435 [Gemmatimonadales bacterium]|nr:hypothetical protein [Gemmatimonadales bacterium]